MQAVQLSPPAAEGCCGSHTDPAAASTDGERVSAWAACLCMCKQHACTSPARPCSTGHSALRIQAPGGRNQAACRGRCHGASHLRQVAWHAASLSSPSISSWDSHTPSPRLCLPCSFMALTCHSALCFDSPAARPNNSMALQHEPPHLRQIAAPQPPPQPATSWLEAPLRCHCADNAPSMRHQCAESSVPLAAFAPESLSSASPTAHLLGPTCCLLLPLPHPKSLTCSASGGSSSTMRQ